MVFYVCWNDRRFLETFSGNPGAGGSISPKKNSLDNWRGRAVLPVVFRPPQQLCGRARRCEIGRHTEFPNWRPSCFVPSLCHAVRFSSPRRLTLSVGPIRRHFPLIPSGPSPENSASACRSISARRRTIRNTRRHPRTTPAAISPRAMSTCSRAVFTY